jgi:hypothetical protein
VVVADDFVVMMLTSLIADTDFIGLRPWGESGGGITVIERGEGRSHVAEFKGAKQPTFPLPE